MLHVEPAVDAQEYLLVRAVEHHLPHTLGEDVEWNRLLAKKYPAVFPERQGHVDEDSLTGDVLCARGDRQAQLDAPLQHGRRHHENDEQHEHHVDKRDDVDFSEGRPDAASALVTTSCIGRRCDDLGHQVKLRSAMFRNSRAKSSMEAEKSFTRCTKWL